MPHGSRRVYATQRIRVIKVVKAPADYVYEWCTDHRSDDWKVARLGTHPRFRVIKISAHRVVRIRLTDQGGSDPDIAVDLVRLQPPDRWHTDQIDEEELETVEYRVTPISPRSSRLEVRVIDRWMTPRFLSPAETRKRVSGGWDRYVGLIESRYRTGRGARG